MSAWVVSKKHIDLMVAGICQGTSDGRVPPQDFEPTALGRLLVKTCVKSVSYRYPDDDVSKGELPGPCDPYYLKPYEFTNPGHRPTAAELAHAVACYRYQSCEYPGWERSKANRLCLRIKELATAGGPEVAERKAPWGFDELEIALCYARADRDGQSLLRNLNEETWPIVQDWLMEREVLTEVHAWDYVRRNIDWL